MPVLDVCLLATFGLDCCSFDETGAAGDGARIERLKSAATAATMRARFIGILLMIVPTKSNHLLCAISSRLMLPVLCEPMMSTRSEIEGV